MNYKKLKRVFALGMAVLLSVSTSVYGGTMEVHAAEIVSDDLLKNEVTDNSSLDENKENKGDDQDDAKDAEQGDSQDNAQDAGEGDAQGDTNDNVQNVGQGDSNDNVQNAEQGDSNDDVQNAGQGDSSDDVQNAGQDDSQDNAQDAGQGTVQGDAQDAGQDATVLTEQDEEPAALAATMAAPTEVESFQVGYQINFGFKDSENSWLNNINKVTVNGNEYKKQTSVYMWDSNAWCLGQFTFDSGKGYDSALRITADDSIEYPATIVASADGCSDFKVKVNRTGYWPYNYSMEVISDTTPDTPAAQTYTVTNVA